MTDRLARANAWVDHHSFPRLGWWKIFGAFLVGAWVVNRV